MTDTLAEFAKAFAILAKYDNSEYAVSVDHDVLYASGTPDTISQDDLEYLKLLGWEYNDSEDCMRKFV